MPHASPAQTERSFGFTVGPAFGLLAALLAWRGRHELAIGAAGLAAALALLAWLKPSLLRIPNAAWWRLAHALGWVNSRIVLSVFFLAVLTPVGLALRLAGRDSLRLRRRQGSGWTPYPERIRDPKHYERMY